MKLLTKDVLIPISRILGGEEKQSKTSYYFLYEGRRTGKRSVKTGALYTDYKKQTKDMC